MSEANASDKTQSFDTRLAHKVLIDGLDSVEASLEGASIERKVEVGSVLWELGDRIKEVLNGIKKDVRAEAVSQLKGSTGSCLLEGDDRGEASVNVPKAVLRIPKGTDMEGIRKSFGSDFPLFFEETVTYSPHKEFEDRVSALDDALDQKVLLSAVERTELTPRVSFRRNKPSKKDGTTK